MVASLLGRIREMISVEISKPLGRVFFDGAFPRNDFDTGVQKKNDAGVPIWSISVVLRQPDSRRSENLTVNVPATKDPNDIFDVLCPIQFEGLKIMTGANKGNTWVSFSADKIEKLAPATK